MITSVATTEDEVTSGSPKRIGHAKHSFGLCIFEFGFHFPQKDIPRHHLFFYSNTFISFMQHPSGVCTKGIMFFCLPV
jgi:hypothetical protein